MRFVVMTTKPIVDHGKQFKHNLTFIVINIKKKKKIIQWFIYCSTCSVQSINYNVLFT